MPLTLLGFPPSELLPAGRPSRIRHPGFPSWRFSGPKGPRPRLQGFLRAGNSTSGSALFTPSRTGALLGFQLLPRLPGALVWSRAFTAHPLVAFPWSVVFCQTPSGPSASSMRSAWRLPLLRAPAVLAFSAFPAADASGRGVGYGPRHCFQQRLRRRCRSLVSRSVFLSGVSGCRRV